MQGRNARDICMICLNLSFSFVFPVALIKIHLVFCKNENKDDKFKRSIKRLKYGALIMHYMLLAFLKEDIFFTIIFCCGQIRIGVIENILICIYFSI